MRVSRIGSDAYRISTLVCRSFPSRARSRQTKPGIGVLFPPAAFNGACTMHGTAKSAAQPVQRASTVHLARASRRVAYATARVPRALARSWGSSFRYLFSKTRRRVAPGSPSRPPFFRPPPLSPLLPPPLPPSLFPPFRAHWQEVAKQHRAAASPIDASVPLQVVNETDLSRCGLPRCAIGPPLSRAVIVSPPRIIISGRPEEPNGR